MLLYSARLYNYTTGQAEKKKEVTDDIRSFTFLLLVNHFELHQCLTNMCLLSFDNFPSSSIWHLLFAFFLTWSNMANQHPLQFPFSKNYLLFICTTFRKMKNKIMLLLYFVGQTHELYNNNVLLYVFHIPFHTFIFERYSEQRLK